MSDPNSRRIVYAAVGAATGVALTPVVAPIVLGWFGFTAIGVVGGSAAAGMQAAIGNVAAGSLFATAQSIAMGGAIPVAVTAVGAGVGAGVGTAAAGEGSDGEDPKKGAGEDGTPVDAKGECPVDEGVRTGRNRCPECRRRDERYCRHAQEYVSLRLSSGTQGKG